MKYERESLLLHEKNLYKAFIILATPVFLSNLLKSFHDLVDTYFIGQLEDSVSAQAAISITWPLINILLAFSIGLSVAGVALISQYLGANREKEAKQFSGLLLLLSIMFGFVINILLYVLSPYVLKWMGAEGSVYDLALMYTRVRSFEMPFLFIFTAFQSVRQAQGDTTTPVYLSITAILINIVLTATFINVFDMGVFGAALGTLIGQAAICLPSIYMLFRKKERLRITLKDMKFDKICMKKLFRMATPAASSQALSSLGFLILQAAILDYGEVVAAAFSLGNKVSNLLLIPIMALGSVLAAYVGQNVGANNKDRAKQAYCVSRNIGLFISIIGGCIIFPFRHQLLGLLTNSSETLKVAAEYMFWVLLTQPLMSMFQNYMGAFNGSGNTKYSFYIATARLWAVRLPLILIFKNCTEFGRSGIWYAMVISNLVIILFAKVLFRKVKFESNV